MDATTIQKLSKLDEAFYRDNAASFASTRQHAWPGWKRVLNALSGCPAAVLDVACGNARFKSFIDESFGNGIVRYFGVDSCPDLLPSSQSFEFQDLDVIGALLEDDLPSSIKAPACDLTVCFGFMHHVPTDGLRTGLLDALMAKTKPGGTFAVSFWQFANDSKAFAKARITTSRGCEELGLELDEGDYLLGWNDVERAYRYCHSFTDDEIDAFAAFLDGRAELVDHFKADGRNGQMNGYLVFRMS